MISYTNNMRYTWTFTRRTRLFKLEGYIKDGLIKLANRLVKTIDDLWQCLACTIAFFQ